MKVDLDKAQKPLTKLRKLLREFPAEPSASDVHLLRTQSRRLEATVHALSPKPDKDALRLLKKIKPLRKAAGGVRDLDVLLNNALTIAAGGRGRSSDEAGRSLARLTEHMDERRKSNAKTLRHVVARRGKKVVELLEEFSNQIEQATPTAEPGDFKAAQLLAAQLGRWPRLNADNLHQFRIHAKELGYMLQLIPGVDKDRIAAFERAKDTAGEWHDWVELSKLAANVLDQVKDRAILVRIDRVVREKLRAALVSANALRRVGLGIHGAAAKPAATSTHGPAQSAPVKPSTHTQAPSGGPPRKPPASEFSLRAAAARRARA